MRGVARSGGTCPVFGVFPSIPVAHCHWQLKCTDLLDLEATEVILFQSLQQADEPYKDAIATAR